MTSQLLHPARNTLFILQSTSRWRPAHNSTLLTSTNIAQHYIPIVTAAPTFPILFSKNLIFKHFLGPFPGPRELLPIIFEFPYSPYISSNFSRRFDLYFRFLLHGLSIHLLIGLVNICFRSKVQDRPNPASYYSRNMHNTKLKISSRAAPSI